MDKIVDLNKTVYDLVQEFPEVKDILASLGFSKITSPMALKVMARVMTIPKGAAMMGIPMETIIRAFASRGLTVKDAPPATESEQQAEIQSHAEKIKQLLKRLGAGEDFESVRKDFVTDFGQVSASSATFTPPYSTAVQKWKSCLKKKESRKPGCPRFHPVIR